MVTHQVRVTLHIMGDKLSYSAEQAAPLAHLAQAAVV